jgi:hypothetical protein
MIDDNNLSDLVRFLRENPDWVDILRGILLSRELLELPTKFPELVAAVADTNAAVAEPREAVAELTAGQAELKSIVAIQGHRLDRLEGRFSNLEGSDYERKVRHRVLTRAATILGLEEPYLALSQNDPESPQLSGAVSNALRERRINHDDANDLHDTDIIISNPQNRHLAVAVSLSSDLDDYRRAYRRAAILRTVTRGDVKPVVVIPDRQEPPVSDDVREVATLVIPR